MNRWTFAAAAVLIFAGAAPAPSLRPVLGAQDWLNGRATPASLAGKVVVLDVFTVDCYNCQNVVPALRALYARDRSRGLAVIGIHSPETPAERGRVYVASSLARQGIVWPVAVDNSFALWNDYAVSAWPTQLFFDRSGHLRKTIVGDSQDDDVRNTVESLLAEKPGRT
jgi:thiol-disulfide isomerase/thioredoxin